MGELSPALMVTGGNVTGLPITRAEGLVERNVVARSAIPALTQSITARLGSARSALSPSNGVHAKACPWPFAIACRHSWTGLISSARRAMGSNRVRARVHCVKRGDRREYRCARPALRHELIGQPRHIAAVTSAAATAHPS